MGELIREMQKRKELHDGKGQERAVLKGKRLTVGPPDTKHAETGHTG